MKPLAFLALSYYGLSTKGFQGEAPAFQDDVLVALVYGTVSAITLPLGAAAGCVFPNASETVIAFMVAFGAGALLFAVTVELYGEAVDRLEEHGFLSGVGEMSSTIIGALLGACIYIGCCRWIDSAVESAEKDTAQSPQSSNRPTRQDFSGMGSRGDLSPNAPPGQTHVAGVYSNKELDYVRGRKRAVMGVLDPSMHTKGESSKSSKDDDPESQRDKYGATQHRAGGRRGDDSDDAASQAACCESKRLHEIRVAVFIWLGALLDGIPEAIMLGYLAAEYKLSFALVVALFVSNFPESFSSAVLLVKHGIERWKVISMWGVLCLFTGVVASLTAWLLPDSMLSAGGRYKEEYWFLKLLGAFVEGMAGGAMLACISNVMLPDAFRRRGDMVGIFVMLGFIMAVSVKTMGGVVVELQR